MGVLKEYFCAAHGAFEAIVKQDEMPKCPRGCSKRFVKREFRTAPGYRSTVTRATDGMVKDIAHDFGLSDMKTDPRGETSVMQNLRKGEDFSPKWVDVPNTMKAGWTQRGETPSAAPVSAFGMQPGNALSSVPVSKAIPTNIVGSHKGD